MAAAFPESRFAGYDFSAEGSPPARAEAAAHGAGQRPFEARDVADARRRRRASTWSRRFDAIHDQAQPDAVLQGIHDDAAARAARSCASTSAASSHVAEQRRPPARPVPLHDLVHALHDRVAGPGRRRASARCGASRQALAMLAEAGFRDVRVETVDGDIINNYYVATA